MAGIMFDLIEFRLSSIRWWKAQISRTVGTLIHLLISSIEPVEASTRSVLLKHNYVIDLASKTIIF